MNFFKIILFFLLFPPLVSAKLIKCGGEGERECTLCDFFVLFKDILDYLWGWLVPVLAGFFFAWGAFQFLLAGEDINKVERGKTIMRNVLIGLLIVYGSYYVIGAFFEIIGVAGWTGLGTWKIQCP